MQCPERPCPVCGSFSYSPFASEQVDPNRLTDFSYASRKEPEFMRLRLVRCLNCDLVYAPAPPTQDTLHHAYSEAAYDSSIEAHYAAKTYAGILEPHLQNLPSRTCAVDIGAGNGALLPKLLRMGFSQVIGIEPSRQAISAAPATIRPYLREGIFSPEIIKDAAPNLMISCMTLEHVENPQKMLQAIHKALLPGGMVAIVVHNRKGFLNKILGLRSPIMDIEHLQLFCPKSIRILLEQSGFTRISVQAFANTYPLKYWLRLSPLPSAIKNAFSYLLEKVGCINMPVKVSVGNMLATGIKNPDLFSAMQDNLFK